MSYNNCENCEEAYITPGNPCFECVFVINNNFKTWPIPWQELWEEDPKWNSTTVLGLTAHLGRGRRK